MLAERGLDVSYETVRRWFLKFGSTIAANLRRIRLRVPNSRAPVERDYRELKQELGLGHYEGRGWPGFHHHAALAVAAYGFLLIERLAIPPSAAHQRPFLQAPALPAGCRPRGAPDPTGAPPARFHRQSPSSHRRGTGKETQAMSLLPTKNSAQSNQRTTFMTQ